MGFVLYSCSDGIARILTVLLLFLFQIHCSSSRLVIYLDQVYKPSLFLDSPNSLLHFHFALKFTTKQLERFSKKCEKEQKVQEGKVKKVLWSVSQIFFCPPNSLGLGRKQVSFASVI